VQGEPNPHQQEFLLSYTAYKVLSAGTICHGKTAMFLGPMGHGTKLRAEMSVSVCYGDTSLRGGLETCVRICLLFASLLALCSQGTYLTLLENQRSTSYLVCTWLIPLKNFQNCKCLIKCLGRRWHRYRAQ
jgi:hypothetical protein